MSLSGALVVDDAIHSPIGEVILSLTTRRCISFTRIALNFPYRKIAVIHVRPRVFVAAAGLDHLPWSLLERAVVAFYRLNAIIISVLFPFLRSSPRISPCRFAD